MSYSRQLIWNATLLLAQAETRHVVLRGNLNAGSFPSTVPDLETATLVDFQNASDFNVAFDVLDPEGVSRRLHLGFFALGGSPDASWEVRVVTDAGNILGGTPGKLQLVHDLPSTLTFSSNGLLSLADSQSVLRLFFNWSNSTNSIIDLNLKGHTNFHSPSNTAEVAMYGKKESLCGTTIVEFEGNLLQSESVVSSLPDFTSASIADLNSSASYVTSFDVVDSFGESHTLRIYFFKTSNSPDRWAVRVAADGSDVLGFGNDGVVLLHSDEPELTFGVSGMRLGPSNRPDVVIQADWKNGAASLAINLSLENVVSFNSPSTASATRISSACLNSDAEDDDGGANDECSDDSNDDEGDSGDEGDVVPGDEPNTLARNDFDGDGKDDLVVYRPEIGFWAVVFSSDDFFGDSMIWKQWGLPGDYPLSGDYTGDGRADLVVWRPSEGNWYVCDYTVDSSCAKSSVAQFGLPGDLPVSADIDGDSILDYCVWRPSTGTFYFRESSTGNIRSRQWGLPGDIPSAAGRN